MDFENFQAKYGYSAPVQSFKGGAKAGVIVAAILSALATLVVILINTIVVLPYYGASLGITHFLPLVAAALMVIMAGVAKPTNKVVLALPATVWVVNSAIAAVMTFRALSLMGIAQGGQMNFIGNAASLVYTIVVALLMWVCCAGSGKSGTVCGVLVTVTAVIGFFIAFIGNFVSLLEAINYYYDRAMTMIISANIFGAAAGMLFYISNAAALFMIAKPKTPPYYYTATQAAGQPSYPTQTPAQTNDNDNTEVK